MSLCTPLNAPQRSNWRGHRRKPVHSTDLPHQPAVRGVQIPKKNNHTKRNIHTEGTYIRRDTHGEDMHMGRKTHEGDIHIEGITKNGKIYRYDGKQLRESTPGAFEWMPYKLPLAAPGRTSPLPFAGLDSLSTLIPTLFFSSSTFLLFYNSNNNSNENTNNNNNNNNASQYRLSSPS